MKKFTQPLKIIILAIVSSFGLSYVYAWTVPTLPPPDGNVNAPINTGATTQTKTGALNVAKLNAEGAPAPASGFSGYSGTTPAGAGNYWPNNYAPEVLAARPSTGVIPGVGGQLTYRGGIGLGPGVGIYSVNPNPAGSSYYGDIRFHTTWWDGSGYRNSDRMTIAQHTGNVGIGTTAPATKLDVTGGAIAIQPSASEQTGSMLIINNGYQDKVGLTLNQNHTANGRSWYIFPRMRGASTSDLNIGYGPISQNSADTSVKALTISNGGGTRFSGEVLGSSCTSSLLGAQAYNNSTGAPLYCNGSVWTAVGGGVFGGTYSVWTFGGACYVANPKTGNCSCPSGTTVYMTGQAYTYSPSDWTGYICY